MDHSRRLFTAVVCATVLLAPASLAVADGDGTRPACVTISSRAQFDGVGYAHIVTVTNGCTARIECDVSTDVNPDPQTVQVEINASTDVVTFRGSPARAFTPHTDCHTL